MISLFLCNYTLHNLDSLHASYFFGGLTTAEFRGEEMHVHVNPQWIWLLSVVVLLNHCLLLLPLLVGVLCLVLVVLCSTLVFFLFLQTFILAEEERAGCFSFIVFSAIVWL